LVVFFSMRRLMSVIKDKHGTYYVQRKVPERLQEAVARVLNDDKSRRVFLKKSLGTKSLKEANAAAVHVLADFNHTIAEAEALLKERPLITKLTDAQIKRMAEAHYASILRDDEEERREGTGSEPVFQSIAKQLDAAGIEYETSFTVGTLPEAGLSDREIINDKAHSILRWVQALLLLREATSRMSGRNWRSCCTRARSIWIVRARHIESSGWLCSLRASGLGKMWSVETQAAVCCTPS
jgi:hypothetical protein